MNKLAIIIPAYKTAFLGETLTSIEKQTCKDFTLYIGDDASPEDVYSIVNNFEHKIDIVYKRFDNNLGNTNLVAHWNRCIDMVGEEEWIWLFSDDDIMGDNCVNLFYSNLNNNPDFDLFHFNVNIIDEKDSLIYKRKPFPIRLNVSEFLLQLLTVKKSSSFAVEYIFDKKHFYESGKFEDFDLAWGSDHATWLKLSIPKGIKTIEGDCIHWRLSALNISSLIKTNQVSFRKINANVSFYNWTFNLFMTKNIKYPIGRFKLLNSFLYKNKDLFPSLSWNQISQIVSNYNRKYFFFHIHVYFAIFIIKTYKNIKQ